MEFKKFWSGYTVNTEVNLYERPFDLKEDMARTWFKDEVQYVWI